MTLTITITCDNAAFGPEDDDCSMEVERILRTVTAALAQGIWLDALPPLRDYNGNKVGKLEVKP